MVQLVDLLFDLFKLALPLLFLVKQPFLKQLLLLILSFLHLESHLLV